MIFFIKCDIIILGGDQASTSVAKPEVHVEQAMRLVKLKLQNNSWKILRQNRCKR